MHEQYTYGKDLDIFFNLLFWIKVRAKAQFHPVLVKAIHMVPHILRPMNFGALRIEIFF